MNRIILTTCGTSLLTSACWNLPGIKSLTIENPDHRNSCERINKQYITKKMKEDRTGEALFTLFNKDTWINLKQLRNLPAELASLRTYMETLRMQEKPPLGESDEIVLLHSGNNEGKYCATVLAAVLPLCLPGIKTSPYPVSDLDPVDYKDFGQGLLKIWKDYCDKIITHHTDNKEIIFNLTGGYKAVVMVLAALCAVRQDIPITIIYLHDSAGPGNLFSMNFNGSVDPVNRLQTDFSAVLPCPPVGGGDL